MMGKNELKAIWVREETKKRFLKNGEYGETEDQILNKVLDALDSDERHH